MQPSLTSLLRPLAWSAVAVSVIAIGVGRLAPRTLPTQFRAAPRYQAVNGRYFSATDMMPRFLDRETGQFVGNDLPAGESLDYASCSPWRDERGQYQVVGRWMACSGQGSGALARDFGLARYTFPEGRVIERVALELMPVSAPCWAPGLSPRILFAAGDGEIYHYSFGESDGSPAADSIVAEPSRPRRVTWRATPPGLGPVHFKDLVWPSEPTLGGRLVASISYQIRVDGKRTFVGPQLWWIELSDDATAIEAVGRLTVAEDPGPLPTREDEERLPNLATTADGGLTLAYLSRAPDQGPWELQVAPVAIDPGTGTPLVRRGSTRAVARHCVTTPPVFSADGRWIYGIVGREPGPTQVTTRRFSVAGALAAAPAGSGPEGRPHATRLDRSDLAGFVASRTSRLVDGRERHHARR